MNVRLSVHLYGGFTTSGVVTLTRADIGGELICQGAQLGVGALGGSLFAPGLRVREAISLDGGFSARGTIWLTGGDIGGQLRCDGARIGADANGDSLICDGLRTGVGVSLGMAGGTAFTALRGRSGWRARRSPGHSAATAPSWARTRTGRRWSPTR
jgi:hypothetical protein